jgi:hypothetical protein
MSVSVSVPEEAVPAAALTAQNLDNLGGDAASSAANETSTACVIMACFLYWSGSGHFGQCILVYQ